MKVLITGTSRGIGKAIAELFLDKGDTVIGIDRAEKTITSASYSHIKVDVCDKDALPAIDGVDILINNAGVQNENDIDVNLKALIYITEKYGVREGINQYSI